MRDVKLVNRGFWFGQCTLNYDIEISILFHVKNVLRFSLRDFITTHSFEQAEGF